MKSLKRKECQEPRLDSKVYSPPIRVKHDCYPREMAREALVSHSFLLSPLGVTANLAARQASATLGSYSIGKL
jgi:hypothetical protein